MGMRRRFVQTGRRSVLIEVMEGKHMGKFLVVLSLLAVMVIGGPASAQQSGRTEAATSQSEVMLAAYRKHKRKRARYSRADWCSKQAKGRECYFCSLTYYGYCQCEYDFPCM
jgi:hypothetical protein